MILTKTILLHIKKPGLKNLPIIYIGYDKMKKTTQGGYIYMTMDTCIKLKLNKYHI